MRKVVLITAVAAAIALGIGGITLFSVYKASQRVPEFYHVALTMEVAEQEDARDAFVAQATALAGDLSHQGEWKSLFTAEQVNAWLALELSENYPDMLPSELRDPRISFHASEATIGCRYESEGVTTVLSLAVEVYLHEPNVVALRILRARAGSLPVPLTKVLDNIAHAARELDLRLQWSKSHGDPVALITLPQPRDGRWPPFNLQTLEIRDGELYMAGTVGGGVFDRNPIVRQPKRGPTASKETPAKAVVAQADGNAKASEELRAEVQPAVETAEKATIQK